MEQELVKVINNFWEKKLLLSADILEKGFEFEEMVDLEIPTDLLILNQDNFLLLKQKKKVNWLAFDKLRVNFESGQKDDYKQFLLSFDEVQEEKIGDGKVTIKKSFKKLFPLWVFVNFIKNQSVLWRTKGFQIEII